MIRPQPAATASPARVAALSYFFPAHDEEANLEGLVPEALEALPAIAERFEIIVVDDGSKDRTPQIADRLAAANPDLVRVVHHPTNLGYGAALRSGFRAARYELVAFTDGDRQFRVADLGRLTARLAGPDAPDAVVGFRIRRADPLIRTVYARLYKLANRTFFGLRVRDVDCACKLFRRESLAGVRVESGGAFFSAELLIKVRAAGREGRGGRRRPLPANGRLADGREAVRRLACRQGLLGPAPAPLGEPGTGAGAGLDDRRLTPAGPRPPRRRSLARRPLAALVGTGLHVQRVHEVAEDRELRLVDRLPSMSSLARWSGSTPARSRTASAAKIRAPVRTASASASDGRESISMGRPADSSMIRAWNVSSARSAMITSRTVAPSTSRTVANRSWVSGRSGAWPWSFMAIALASHGPIQMGR